MNNSDHIYDIDKLDDREVLQEALTLISTLTDPAAKTPGRTMYARAILSRLRSIVKNHKPSQEVYEEIRTMVVSDEDDSVNIIDDYARKNGLSVKID